MSRSIGDLVATKAGVVPDPDTVTHELAFEDKLLVLATDGVWEFVSNQLVAATQCVEVLGKYWEANDIEGGCDRLLDESLRLWQAANASAQGSEVIDDISFIVVFLR